MFVCVLAYVCASIYDIRIHLKYNSGLLWMQRGSDTVYIWRIIANKVHRLIEYSPWIHTYTSICIAFSLDLLLFFHINSAFLYYYLFFFVHFLWFRYIIGIYRYCIICLIKRYFMFVRKILENDTSQCNRKKYLCFGTGSSKYSGENNEVMFCFLPFRIAIMHNLL